MKVNVGIYETPQPSTSGETGKKVHARVRSNGIKKLGDICDSLYEKGINSAQIKAVLDGIAIYIGRALKYGYTVEMEEVGIFSLSVGTETRVDDEGKEMIRVAINGVNFRPSPVLRKRIKEAEIEVNKDCLGGNGISQERKKRKLIRYLEENTFIHVLGYSQLIGCSRYRAGKELETFREEGLLKISGKGNRQVYLLQTP